MGRYAATPTNTLPDYSDMHTLVAWRAKHAPAAPRKVGAILTHDWYYHFNAERIHHNCPEGWELAVAEDEALRVPTLTGEPRWLAEIAGGAYAELAAHSYTPAELREVVLRAADSKREELRSVPKFRFHRHDLSHLDGLAALELLEDEFVRVYQAYSDLGMEWRSEFYWDTHAAWFKN